MERLKNQNQETITRTQMTEEIPIAKCQKMRNVKNATSITGPTKESVKKSTHNAMDMIIAPDIALVVFQDGL